MVDLAGVAAGLIPNLGNNVDSGVGFLDNAPLSDAGWSSWQLVGLITRRSQVQVLPPQPKNSTKDQLLNRIGPFLFLAQAFRCVLVHRAAADNVAKALGWYCQVILPTLSFSSVAVLLQRRPGDCGSH
jgi:hypothetical protein